MATLLFFLLALAAAAQGKVSIQSVFNWQNVTNSVLWVPQVGLDCRSTCYSTFLQAVGAYKPSEADPAPPLLCAHVGTIVKDPTLVLPGSLATDAYKFFLSVGYTRPQAANKTSGRPAVPDPDGCSSYLEATTPNAQLYLCGCVPPRKTVMNQPQKAWRWVPASSSDCNLGSWAFQGYLAPFICRVRATGLLGHLNTQNCGFPYPEVIQDCEYGGLTWDIQPASGWKVTQYDYVMPRAREQFPDCLYQARSGVAGSTQETAGWNSIDRLCVLSSFKYFVYRWPKSLVEQPGSG